LTKIKTKFTENEQQIFVASFYGFLNYDSKMDFVINLDDVWKWLKFSTKQKAKMLLENVFVIDIDYKILPNLKVKQTLQPRGGRLKMHPPNDTISGAMCRGTYHNWFLSSRAIPQQL
jgi:hypothetical protein